MTANAPSLLRLASLCLALSLSATTAVDAEVRIRPTEKTPAAEAPPTKLTALASRLLLPHFQIDASAFNGETTLFAVRNESTAPVAIEIRYYATDRPHAPQFTEQRTLGAKRISTVQMRGLVDNLLVDDDGFARGYLVVEALSGEAVLHGDYFQLTADQGFATGHRLVNIDPASNENELCTLQTIRFLNGGPFDGGTQLIVWLEAESQPTFDEPVLFYSVYNEAGSLIFTNELFADQVAMRLSVATLVQPIPTSFGALEIQFNNTVGHVAAVMSALGLYSVGFEATCTN